MNASVNGCLFSVSANVKDRQLVQDVPCLLLNKQRNWLQSPITLKTKMIDCIDNGWTNPGS